MAWTYEITDEYQTHYSYSDNATEVYNYLEAQGYSQASIIGVLANMEHESYINTGQQEHGYNGSTSRGYGLVQWTPAKDKILKYAESVGGNWYDGAIQMAYFDINVPASWKKTKNYPYTFSQFKNLDDIYTATRTFFYNFERGTYHDELDDYAEYWFNYFSGEEPPTPPTPPTPPSPSSDSIDYILVIGKKLLKRRFQ